MNELLRTYVEAWPGVWMVDTARYLVGAGLMAGIVAVFWRAGLARRKLQVREPRATIAAASSWRPCGPPWSSP